MTEENDSNAPPSGDGRQAVPPGKGAATAGADSSGGEVASGAGEFPLLLEPDYCCGGGHCGPLPGYFFQCPSCGKRSGCRTGEPLQPGQVLTCYLCKRRLRMVRELTEFELVFVYCD